MSKVIIPADRDDLIELIISGYDFSDDMVLLYFRMSRTQYYDYVFKVLDKVKVTTDLRGYSVKDLNNKGLSESSVEVVENILQRLDRFKEITLFNYVEVFNTLLVTGRLSVEMYDGEYIKLNESEAMEHLEFLTRGIVVAKKRKELEVEWNFDQTLNVKTRESRFKARLSTKKHMRIIICGIYFYAVPIKSDEVHPAHGYILAEFDEIIKKVRVA